MQPRRRRRLPPNVKGFKVPLEKVFDLNTISNYEDNARAFYCRPSTPPTSDLPLRDNSENLAVRESLIDLDASLIGGDLAQFADLNTIKPRPRSSDAATDPTRRRTQDWVFPTSVPASAGLDVPNPESTGHSAPIDWNRMSATSLIDLDASLVPSSAARPSTADSDVTSTESENGNTPFHLESQAIGFGWIHPTREPSIYMPADDISSDSEPSIYVPDGVDVFSADEMQQNGLDATVTIHGYTPPESRTTTVGPPVGRPPTPPPPSTDIMQGMGSQDEVKDELRRMIASLGEHLQACNDVLGGLPVRSSEHYHAKKTSP
ncbi:hypothetical protein TOPH_06904 [Tolypocladium ophioglossoides CBS 100239]|uniref:Uncharacterized protein n=1 Tax=Tolypocladium ophioglossoides (strain CBS 100239) TaxID=1163406 RepID=A0A0L0N3F7_TOLOC|nr:hypothetical protein TOPH_06904 [Tolypocladium ophioglossoides CBS 100239]